MMRYITIAFLWCFSTAAAAKVWPVRSAVMLQHAVAAAAATDTIQVAAGYYRVGNIKINKPLTLLGVNYPRLDAQFKNEIFTISASGTHIEGFQFENVGETSTIDWAGVKVLEASHVRIRNNRFITCYFGIYLSACSNVIIENNQVKGKPKDEQTTGNGIHAWKCDSLQINNNYVEGHRDGIYFEFVTNSLIKDNYSKENIRYGLHFMFSHNDVYERNTFEANGAGVAVMYTKLVTMRHNIFLKNWGSAAYGILLKDISDSHIESNRFYQNTVGIMMEGCSRSVIRNNQYLENGIAIRLQANCDANKILSNDFVANTFDMATNGQTFENEVQGNYWDKYDGYDLNRDTFGDVPYRPVSLFSMLIEQVPQAIILVRSFTALLLDKIEKTIPTLTPENFLDERPAMKPVVQQEAAIKS